MLKVLQGKKKKKIRLFIIGTGVTAKSNLLNVFNEEDNMNWAVLR